jgi:RNA polymerase primary sigma factor
MIKEKKYADLQKLISRGRNKGYLTYEEINKTISSEVTTERMDDMIMVLEEMDIQLVDDETKLKLKAGDADGDGDSDDDTEGTELTAEDGRVSDPVKMYLREMGLVSLLTREGEVEIAKRIEKGERKAIGALLESSLGVKEMLKLGEMVDVGMVRIKDVVRDIDDEESMAAHEQRQKEFLALVEKVRRLDKRNMQTYEKLSKRDNGIKAEERKKLRGNLSKNRRKVSDMLADLKLEKRQVDQIADSIKARLASIERAEGLMSAAMMESGMPKAEITKLARKIRAAKGKKVAMGKCRCKPNRLLELETMMKQCRATIREVENECKMGSKSLRRIVNRVRDGRRWPAAPRKSWWRPTCVWWSPLPRNTPTAACSSWT